LPPSWQAGRHAAWQRNGVLFRSSGPLNAAKGCMHGGRERLRARRPPEAACTAAAKGAVAARSGDACAPHTRACDMRRATGHATCAAHQGMPTTVGQQGPRSPRPHTHTPRAALAPVRASPSLRHTWRGGWRLEHGTQRRDDIDDLVDEVVARPQLVQCLH